MRARTWHASPGMGVSSDGKANATLLPRSDSRPAPIGLVVLDDGAYRYVYGLDLMAAIDGSDAPTYFSYDGLGSTTDLTDENADVIATWSYDVFGAVRASTGSSDQVFRFTGEQEDADTGLYFLRARYMDPESGRFISRDPIELPQRYAYAGSNPVNYVDPDGRCFGAVGRLCRKAADAARGARNAVLDSKATVYALDGISIGADVVAAGIVYSSAATGCVAGAAAGVGLGSLFTGAVGCGAGHGAGIVASGGVRSVGTAAALGSASLTCRQSRDGNCVRAAAYAVAGVRYRDPVVGMLLGLTALGDDLFDLAEGGAGKNFGKSAGEKVF